MEIDLGPQRDTGGTRTESYVQLETQAFVGVESSGLGDQTRSQIGMYLPRAALGGAQQLRDMDRSGRPRNGPRPREGVLGKVLHNLSEEP